MVRLAVHCGHSFRGDIPVPYEKSGPAAVHGTAVHAAIEAYLDRSEYPKEADDEKVFATFSTWLEWWDRVGGRDFPGAMTEVPMVLDVQRATVRQVPRGAHRAYGEIGPFEIPMTIDLCSPCDGPIASLYDWKTGRPGDACAPQLATNALALSIATGATAAFAQAIYLTPQVVIEAEPVELDALDLGEHLDTLRRVMRALPMAEPVPGPHCKSEWCKLREKCTAHRAYLREERAA